MARRSHRPRPSSRERALDVSSWKPKLHPSETLDQAFFRRCHQIEREISARVEYEKQFNENNFDSGWTVEEIVRQAFVELLPQRYAVRAASISDSKGFSAGDFDVAIYNDTWFPAVKSGPTAESRKMYLPIEGVYAVLEVKQTLTRKSLEDAMKKLVTCHRLFRPNSSCDRMVENDQRSACTHYVSNPLYSAVLAVDLDSNLSRDKAVEHFIRINQMLPRTDVVRCLCILGHGSVIWAYRHSYTASGNPLDGMMPATFMKEDRYEELIPIYGRTDTDDSPFYELTQSLMAHLLSSVLAPENIANHYGHRTAVQIPNTAGATLLPDPDLQRSLDDLCIGHDRSTDRAYHQPNAPTA